jgi:hypothetical protein
MAKRTITVRYTGSRDCPNCGGGGDDGAAWRPTECRRCKGRGSLITGVEVEDSIEGLLPRSRYDFYSTGEVELIDFDEADEIEVVGPE